MDLEEIARKYALRNAVDHGGECNPGSVIGKIFSEEEFENKGEVQQKTQKIAQEVNELSIEQQEEKLEEYEFDEKKQEHDPIPDLDVGEDEEVVVRFAPNPNGPPHIGHARGMVINGELRDKYDGKLILRFDDTDPRKKRPLKTAEHDAYEMYLEDYEWLGYKPDEIRYSSKNFDNYIMYAEKLIEEYRAYVCFCSQEEGSKYRSEGEPCPHRDTSIEENMGNWKKMKNGGISEGEATLKIKTDIDHKNPAIRDFVAFRIIENPDHPVTGDEYRVWPMLDFQGAIEDHEMGTTHIVRGKDLRASTKRQKYIYDYFDWEYPYVRYWGDVQISGFNAPVSGSYLKEMIKKGELDGWDDPRAPTLRALRKRGFQPDAIQNFFIDMGVSENNVEASIKTLESENTDIIDEQADRHFFVKNPVRLKIRELPENIETDLPLHPDYPDRGTRDVDVETENGEVELLIEENDFQDGFVRLKGLCNISVDEDDRSAEFIEGDHKKAMEEDADIIHWLPEDSPEGTVYMPDGSEIRGRVEDAVINPGEVIQFERFGFARSDDGEKKKFYFAHN
ncbi:MAG: glutamate--tRNA ligase [Nanohaloarchaea archaeon SW_7_43_1]|nr:MAG: glutamate--tRNA ligase [Nanohaloarchaea archaeon SW_7_43_1]